MMQRLGNVDEKEMFRTFNMGIGMIVICSGNDKGIVMNKLQQSFEIGRVVAGERSVSL